MFTEAKIVWNRALALQRRYYKIYGLYISYYRMGRHFTKRFKRHYLSARTVQCVLRRQDISYRRFFNKISRRPPKFKKKYDITTLEFNQKKEKYLDSCSLHDNFILINNIKKKFKFFKSRDYNGKIKKVFIKKDSNNNYYITIVTDWSPSKYRKSHNGASVGIDFGLKDYLTLSNGIKYSNPEFLRKDFTKFKQACRKLSNAKKNSNNRERKRSILKTINTNIVNKRNDFQWKLAHTLCQLYDYIFIEDLNIIGMRNLKKCRTKLKDYAHSSFVEKLMFVSRKYGVTVHKIDRFFPSSRLCTCGYNNNKLSLDDRIWTCPECGTTHHRDLLAANNILRRGIYELESDSKTSKHLTERQSR